MVRELPLRSGLFPGKVALVDDEDYQWLSWFGWMYCPSAPNEYAMRSDGNGALHRLITNASPGLVVDHINHDGLDNRRANLRLVTLAENSRTKRSAVPRWPRCPDCNREVPPGWEERHLEACRASLYYCALVDEMPAHGQRCRCANVQSCLLAAQERRAAKRATRQAARVAATQEGTEQ